MFTKTHCKQSGSDVVSYISWQKRMITVCESMVQPV